MIRAFQWDLARQVERLDWLLAQLPKYSRWGYNELYLHLEDAIDYPSLPGVARRDAYSWRQFGRLVHTADQVGIKVVPIVNLLGHTQYLIKTDAWRDLNELRAEDGSPLPEGQICPSHPRTVEAARKLIADVAPFCTAGKLHVGLDESFLLGRHPDSQREVAAIGLARYFANYVGQLDHIVQEHGLRTGLWADMLALLPDAIEHLPRGLIAYDWYYHGFDRHPRFEARNYRAYDLVPALRRQGAEYWGCPMNGAFRHEPLPVFSDRLANAMSWWQRCQRTNAEGFLVTGWEPNRLALPTTQVVDAAIAGLWLDENPHDQVQLLQNGFARVHGRRGAAEFARRLIAGDEYAFSGYARWEPHRRWDTVHGRAGAHAHAAEERFFARGASLEGLPPVFRVSLGWRHYLAARDRFIREMAAETQRARRLLHRGRAAELDKLIRSARETTAQFEAQFAEAGKAIDAMWSCTRKRVATHPNRIIWQDDRKRWRNLSRWWSRADKDSIHLRSANEVFGPWQVQALVHITHPNLQAVVVQIQQDDGSWQDVHQRYLIEFRSYAARRRTQVRRWLSFPVDSPQTAIRFALRGLGCFSLSDVHLTDGVTEYRAQGRNGILRRRVTLGDPRDTASVLAVDRTQNRAAWQPRWIQVRDA